MRRLRIILLVALTLGPTVACFGHKPPVAVVLPKPTGNQVQDVRALAVRIMDEVRRGVAVARIVRNSAQNLVMPKGPITISAMNTIDDASIKYGNELADDLKLLDNITSMPSLKTTAHAILDATARFTGGLAGLSALGPLVDILLATFDVTSTTAKGGV